MSTLPVFINNDFIERWRRPRVKIPYYSRQFVRQTNNGSAHSQDVWVQAPIFLSDGWEKTSQWFLLMYWGSSLRVWTLPQAEEPLSATSSSLSKFKVEFVVECPLADERPPSWRLRMSLTENEVMVVYDVCTRFQFAPIISKSIHSTDIPQHLSIRIGADPGSRGLNKVFDIKQMLA